MESALGIYIHWPFCASKCPYCDFNSHVAARIDHERWAAAYERELTHYAALTAGRTVSSIFFGGGTPSLMASETVARVIAKIKDLWPVAADVEVTLEANPTSVEAGKFKAFRQAGVNRVSLGVQAFDDAALQFLGRQHSVKEAREALDIARQNFDRCSFDLIYARPNQNVKDWQEELEIALEYAPDHVSLYQLTIEKSTPFYMRHARGEFYIPENDEAADLYETTCSVLAGAGLPAYEISNYARAGQESRHNLVYWRYQDYVGVGPGAHGRLTQGAGEKSATRGHRAPDIWLARVEEQGHGAHPFESLTREERFTEALMMGLRLREGVALNRLSTELGAPWSSRIDEKRLQALVTEGLLEQTQTHLLPMQAGMQRLNSVLSYLI